MKKNHRKKTEQASQGLYTGQEKKKKGPSAACKEENGEEPGKESRKSIREKAGVATEKVTKEHASKETSGEAEEITRSNFQHKKTSRARHRRNHRNLMLAGICLLVLTASGFAIAAVRRHSVIQAWMDIQPDERAVTGRLHEEGEHEVAEGNFWVLVNQLPTLEEGSRECNIEYENPSSNHYSARLSLYRKDTGRLIGHTRRIDPGNYVETIRLNQDFPPGEYPLTARIELFQDTSPAGEMTLELTMRITSQPST